MFNQCCALEAGSKRQGRIIIFTNWVPPLGKNRWVSKLERLRTLVKGTSIFVPRGIFDDPTLVKIDKTL